VPPAAEARPAIDVTMMDVSAIMLPADDGVGAVRTASLWTAPKRSAPSDPVTGVGYGYGLYPVDGGTYGGWTGGTYGGGAGGGSYRSISHHFFLITQEL
jgi:CubicO group peptidase (beta-lactamase class C family)